MNLKRFIGETFEAFRWRRREANLKEKIALKTRGKIISIGGRSVNRKKSKTITTTEWNNPAIGKRHACESPEAFKERRRICNAKRRQREKERKFLLNSQ